MKKILLLIFCSCSWLLPAQESVFRGRLIDAETLQPLGEAVILKDEKIVATSSEAGFFKTDCSPGSSLRIRLAGYDQAVVQMASCGSLTSIALHRTVHALGQVYLKGDSHRNRLELPRSGVVLERAQLQRGTGLFLDDAVNESVPGVTMNRRAVSSGQQFNIRGYGNGVGFRGASNNFDGQGYKVYLNHIPITDAEGVTILDDLDFASLGGVEFIKGPAGTRYGFAIAGAVKLQTLKPAVGQTSFSQKLILGEYGLLRSSSSLATATDNFSLLASYGHQLSDGFMAHSASEKDFVNLLLGFTPAESREISLFLGYADSYDQRGGELTPEQFESGDFSGNERYIKNNAHAERISFRAGINHLYRFSDWLSNSSSLFGTGVNSNASSAGGWTDSSPLNYGLRSVFDLDLPLTQNFKLEAAAGIELQQQHSRISGYRMVEDPEDSEGYNIIGTQKSDQAVRSGSAHYFTDWTLKMPWELDLTAGVGLSTMKLSLADRSFDPSNPRNRELDASYRNLLSPHFALNKRFDGLRSVYLSYSTGWKAPVGGNIVLPLSGDLNIGLEPEKGEQWELGSRGRLFSRAHYQLALYRTRFSDKFTSVAVPLDETTTAYTYIANGGSQLHKGVEFMVNYEVYRPADNFLTALTPYFNFTYSDPVYEDFRYETLDSQGEVRVADYSGKPVAGVSPWVVNAGFDFSTSVGLYGNAGYSYRDGMPFSSDGENRTDAFSLLHAKLGYAQNLGPLEFTIFAGAENLTGSRYYYMVFLNQLPDAYLPAPKGVNFYGGLHLSLRL